MVRGSVVIGFVAVLSLLYYGLYLKNLKKLGERETENVPNLEPAGQTRSFIFLIAAILLVASYIILEYRELDVLEVFVLAVGGYCDNNDSCSYCVFQQRPRAFMKTVF